LHSTKIYAFPLPFAPKNFSFSNFHWNFKNISAVFVCFKSFTETKLFASTVVRYAAVVRGTRLQL